MWSGLGAEGGFRCSLEGSETQLSAQSEARVLLSPVSVCCWPPLHQTVRQRFLLPYWRLPIGVPQCPLPRTLAAGGGYGSPGLSSWKLC